MTPCPYCGSTLHHEDPCTREMSRTPRTDASTFKCMAVSSDELCHAHHARTLERELTLAQSELAKTQSERDKAEAVCETLRKAQAFIKSEQDDEVAALRADADRKTALIVELREKLVTAEQTIALSKSTIKWLVAPTPSSVCRHCGKEESEHFYAGKFCDRLGGRNYLRIFTPTSPEPISTKGGDELCAVNTTKPATVPTVTAQNVQPVSNAAPVAVRTSDGERQKTLWKELSSILAGRIRELQKERMEGIRALATAQERIVELEAKFQRELENHFELKGQRDAALAEVAELRRERDEAVKDVQHVYFAKEVSNLCRARTEAIERAAALELKWESDEPGRPGHMYRGLCDLIERLPRAKYSSRPHSLFVEELAVERDSLRTQLDLAQRQIAAKDAALKKARLVCITNRLFDKDQFDTVVEACNAALSPDSARLYVRRSEAYYELVEWLKARPGDSWKATVSDIEQAVAAMATAELSK